MIHDTVYGVPLYMIQLHIRIINHNSEFDIVDRCISSFDTVTRMYAYYYTCMSIAHWFEPGQVSQGQGTWLRIARQTLKRCKGIGQEEPMIHYDYIMGFLYYNEISWDEAESHHEMIHSCGDDTYYHYHHDDIIMIHYDGDPTKNLWMMIWLWEKILYIQDVYDMLWPK